MVFTASFPGIRGFKSDVFKRAKEISHGKINFQSASPPVKIIMKGSFV